MTLQALPPADPPAAVIVVTGKALPDPTAERAYSVETIDRDRLVNSPSNRVDEILKQVPGLQLFRRSDSSSGHPTSQGVTLRSLGGNASSRALLILDGVPQTDPFGGWVNWPAYDPASLEEIRVVRGGGSVAHGPGALAGAIEMSSLAAPGANGALELGSRESMNARGYFGSELGGGLLTINAQGARGSGFIPLTEESRGPVDEPAAYREADVRARWIVPVAAVIELQASALGFVDVRERGVPFTGNRTRGADASVRLVGSGAWQWSATAYAQWRNFRSSFASVDDERTTAERVALQDSVPSRGLGGIIELRPPAGRAVELRVGADVRSTTGQSRELYFFNEGEPTRRRIAGGDSVTAGVFGEAAWERGPLTVSGGGRIDHWRIADGELVERLLATGVATRDEQYPERSGWLPTARAAALIDVGGEVSLRSAAYLGWRMPTLNELFRPFRAGPDATAANALLDPERLSGVEAGFGYRRGSMELSLSAFANRLSDAIANVTLGQGPGVFPGVGFVSGEYRQRQNLSAVNVRGIEASAEFRGGPWSVRLGASLNDAQVDARGSAAALNGLRPAQTPAAMLTAGVTWSRDGKALSLLTRHVGDQFEDDLNLRRLRAATTFDAFGAWPLGKRVQLFARGENLLDATVMAGIGDGGTIERATPRTVSLGVRFGR